LLSPWPNKLPLSSFPITAQCPAAFVCTATDDHTAPPAFARGIVAACREAGVPVSFWEVPTGGHGAFTIGGSGPGAVWAARFSQWLQDRGLFR
jgi:acetyl esterase/lipase